jgi:hypothetical protein
LLSPYRAKQTNEVNLVPLVSPVILLGLACSASALPKYSPKRPEGDWLLGRVSAKADVFESVHGIVLSNGLVSREFQTKPNATTVAIDDLMNEESLLRAVGPEAEVEIDGKSLAVGGLSGQTNRAFITDELLKILTPIPGALQYEGFEVGATQAKIPWVKTRHHVDEPWPPRGKRLTLRFGNATVQVDVIYELYDGVALFSKQLRVTNHGNVPFHLTGYQLENLGLVEAGTNNNQGEWRKPRITEATDFTFAGQADRPDFRAIRWETDPTYTSQVSYDLKTPCQLVVESPLGPDAEIKPSESFETFRSFMLIHDSDDRERQGLAVRHMYRLLAPWTSESPIMLHMTSSDALDVKRAIDQAAEVGFEMVILSFGSGLDMEDVSHANLKKYGALAEYAHSKGIQLGGYSLLASRSIDPQTDVIDPKTMKPGGAVFGSSPCLCSVWGTQYFDHLKTFLQTTGFDLLEHDGSYPGDVCAATNHPGHNGLADSQWNQFQVIAAFYRWCRGRGIYLNVPDDYFLTGSNKTGMGYREDNWSLPREQQHILARQNLFDGTWEKTPSMGWMFTPLVEYHGGGAAATIEPLKDHLQDYGLHLMNNFGYGVQSCYRGYQIYDTETTRDMVRKWVSWFKAHREILESDVIHVKRADGRNLDAVLHVNPALPTQAIAVIYNPLSTPLKQEVVLPLYYSGLKGDIHMSLNDGELEGVSLDQEGKVKVMADVPGKSCIWIAFSK